jgi:hypothetical protein
MMNERIKELAEQAGYTEAYYESDYGPFVPAEFNKEKFAELIITKCCDIFVELRTRPADLAVLDVKKHFGVEE